MLVQLLAHTLNAIQLQFPYGVAHKRMLKLDKLNLLMGNRTFKKHSKTGKKWRQVGKKKVSAILPARTI